MKFQLKFEKSSKVFAIYLIELKSNSFLLPEQLISDLYYQENHNRYIKFLFGLDKSLSFFEQKYKALENYLNSNKLNYQKKEYKNYQNQYLRKWKIFYKIKSL